MVLKYISSSRIVFGETDLETTDFHTYTIAKKFVYRRIVLLNVLYCTVLYYLTGIIFDMLFSELATGFLDWMVAHLGLRTHEILYKEIGNIIAGILSAWESYEAVANHAQRIFT